MDELTRTGLRGLQLAQRGVMARPAVSMAVAGFAAGALVVVAGGRLGTSRTVIPLTSWLGLMSVRRRDDGGVVPGTLMLCGIVALLLLWLVAIRLRHAWSERAVWCVAAAWVAPFAIGPPMLSNDVWRYAANGLLLRRGLDPYSVGPSALGNVHAVAAVDPTWRSVPSTSGPLATTAQHLAIAISGGNALGAVLVFRALGLVCFVAIGVLAAELAGPRRVPALTLTVLNPLLLLHVVSGAHLDGAAVRAAARGGARGPPAPLAARHRAGLRGRLDQGAGPRRRARDHRRAS